MTTEKHGHKHHGKSSRDILDPKRVLTAIGLKEGQNFMDAGCGDGFISIEASNMVKARGKVYAVDAYEPSLDGLRREIEEFQISNIEVILADMTLNIPLEDSIVDICVMANVLHGFASEGTLEPVLNEIKRVIKPGGTFAVVEFNKVEGPPGPPYNVRLSPESVEQILEKHGFVIRGTQEVGRYHYLVESVKMK
ncbi:MAG: class I SAM-dependent methyltransferase [Methanobacteriaceae archaeon]|nr:class I SAM-dependent methyltransferase [Methanobacteriaceae archaeon]